MTVGLEKHRSKKRLGFYAYAVLGGVLFLVAAVIAWNLSFTVRRTGRWVVWSQRYKAEVLAQPSTGRELKHIEWDGWGWAGIDTIVYLVFDPSDSLSAAARAHRSGKFKGIPCEVPTVVRMEKNWYAVQFYTEESWGQRNSLDCISLGD